MQFQKKSFSLLCLLTFEFLWENQIVLSLYDLFEKSVKQYPNNMCLGTRTKTLSSNESKVTYGPYQWKNYVQIAQRRDDFGSGLLSEKLIEHGDRVGIFSLNCEEWILVDLAAAAFGFVSVGINEAVSPTVLKYILAHAECDTIIVGSYELFKLLMKYPKYYKNVISIPPISSYQTQLATSSGITLYNFSRIEEVGRKNPQKHIPPSSDQIYSILYTSGATGESKGVLLSHGNMVANVAAILYHETDLIKSGDIHISYLPLAHSLERSIFYVLFAMGAGAGFYSGVMTFRMISCSS